MKTSIKQQYIQWVTNHPAYCLMLSFLFIAICWSGLSSLGYSGDYRHLFDKENAYFQKMDEINTEFIQNSNVVFIVTNPTVDIFSKKQFSSIKNLTEKSWEMPHSLRVDSITNFQRIYSIEDTFFVETLLESLATEKLTFSDLKEIALGEDSIRDRLISKNGRTTAIVVSIFLPDDDRNEALSDTVNYARQIQAEFQKNNPELEIYLTGEIVMDQVLLEIVLSDMSILMSLMITVGFAILWFLLRSLFAAIATGIMIVLSLTCALGIAGWSGFIINNISAASPMTIMIIAIADAIHILTPFIIAMRNGDEKKQALQKSLDINLAPITITSLTTGIGFLGLNFAGASAFRDFGNIIALGVLTAYILSLVFLPALILLLPIKGKKEPFAITSVSERIAKFSIKYAKFNLCWPIVLAVFCLFQIPKINFDDDIARNIDTSVPFRAALEHANDNLMGYQSLVYALDSKNPNGINEPTFLSEVDQFIEWYRTQPNVTNVSSYIDTVKQLNQAMNQDNPTWHKIPDDKSLASQYMLLYEMSLPAGKDLTADLNIERSALRIQVTLKQISNNDLIDLEKRASQWLSDHAPELQTIGTSQSLLLAYLGRDMVDDMISGSVTVLIAITLILIIGLRSIRFGLLSIIPNLLPAIMVYGIWAVTIQQVNAAAALTFSVSLGLVVDDTIHFLSKYLDARRNDLSAEDAIHYAFKSCGTALFVTTVALGSGIALLTFSQFLPNATSAMLLSPIIFTALLIDFLFLPALLLALEKVMPFKKTLAT